MSKLNPAQSSKSGLQKQFGDKVKVFQPSEFEEGIVDIVQACQQIQNEFYDKIRNVPYEPPVWKQQCAVTVFEDLADISTTETHLVISAKAKNLSRLQQFKKLEYLGLENPNDKAIEELRGLKHVETLYLRRGTYSSLDAIGHLTKMTDLIIEQNVKLERLDGIEKLVNLRTLMLQGLRRVKSIKPVANLKSLIGLRVQHGYVSGFSDQVVVESLQPIAGLKNLRMIDFNGTTVSDGNFSPLLKLPVLEDVWMSPTHELTQLAFLAAHFPSLERRWSVALFETYACSRCGTQKGRYIGSDRPHWCPKCNEKKVAERLNAFSTLIQKYRGTALSQPKTL